MILADSRQFAIRRSLLQVFCAYFAKNFTHPFFECVEFLGLTDIFIGGVQLT